MRQVSKVASPGEFSSMNIGNMAQTGNYFGKSSVSNSATLKGKLQSIEEQIQVLADTMNGHKVDVMSLKTEKDTLEDILKLKTEEVKNILLQRLGKVEDEMKRHFSHQTSENGRLQQQISSLKAEKSVLQNQLCGLQRRISDLEQQVGVEDK